MLAFAVETQPGDEAPLTEKLGGNTILSHPNPVYIYKFYFPRPQKVTSLCLGNTP
jgi:hypothetical protein